MKKSELYFNLFAVPLDALMLIVAGVVSFYIRLHSVNVVGPVLYNLQLPQFLKVVYAVIPVLLLIFAALGLYNLKGTRRFGQEILRIVIGVSVALFLVIVLFFFNQSLFPSRFIVLSAWALSIILVVFGRLISRLFQEYAFKLGYGLHRLVIINGDNQESKVMQRILNDHTFGYSVVSELDYDAEIVSRIDTLYKQRRFDEIMQTNPSLTDRESLQLVEFARNKGIQFSFVPNLFEVQRNSVEVNDYRGIPIISLKNSPLDGWGKVVKRILDIMFSLVCLIITSPLFLIIAIVIKLNSPGKIFYVAKRGGRGKDFDFYKFRTMFTHLSVGHKYGGEKAEQVRQMLWEKNDRGGKQSPFLKIKHDPRVTSVGRFLRKTKLDEIPQFWNVLKGDMSMVGPRAHVLDEVERYRNKYRRMFSIKPGIFGLSQIAQIHKPDLPFDDEISLNTNYIENWSIFLDLKILAISFLKLFFSHKIDQDY
jgi:exopolysaccharide biosynthesis polyprenyl glycosylphosphotransferase